MTTQMRDADMPLLDRIDAAIKRVTSGQGQMRVPVEATDPDMVLFDCKREIEQLRAAIEAAEGAQPEPARQPMTIDRARILAANACLISGTDDLPGRVLRLIRLVERHHRISSEETTR